MGVGIVMALLLALGACSSSGSETTADSPARVSLQMRPVEKIVPPGTELTAGWTVLDSSQPDGTRYAVGPVAISERDVSRARAREIQPEGRVVDLTLTRHGTKALHRLAQERYPLRAPQNSVAIVVDGKVQSAPAFQTPTFEGGRVQIDRLGLTEDQAKQLAGSLHR